MLFTEKDADARDDIKQSDGAIRRTPELSNEETVVSKKPKRSEFAFDNDEQETDDAATQRQALRLARAASLNPNDGIDL